MLRVRSAGGAAVDADLSGSPVADMVRRGRDDESGSAESFLKRKRIKSVAVNRRLAVGALESWRITRLKRRLIVWCLGAALLLVLVLASMVGAVPLPFAELFHALVGSATGR